jgi:hypothetical protein
MRKVTREEFLAPIFDKRLDVQPRIVNDRYPYTAIWEFHRQAGRPAYGKTVDRIESESGVKITDYFVSYQAGIE